MAQKLQMQWKTRVEGGEWKYHSSIEEQLAYQQIEKYIMNHGDNRIFDYRVVDTRSKDAVAKPVDPIFRPLPGKAMFQYAKNQNN